MVQVVVALFAMLWSAAFTLVIALALKLTLGWRLAGEDELEGIDLVVHGETAYEFVPRPSGPHAVARPTERVVPTVAETAAGTAETATADAGADVETREGARA